MCVVCVESAKAKSGWSRPMMGRRNKLRCPLNGGTWRQSLGTQVVSLSSFAPGSTARRRKSSCLAWFGVLQETKQLNYQFHFLKNKISMADLIVSLFLVQIRSSLARLALR